MHPSTLMQTRYTTKAFDPAKKIAAEDIQALCQVLNLAPSSVNSQPWHFFLADTPEQRNKLAEGTRPGFPYNEQKILNASHVFVLCARNDYAPDYLDTLLAQEAQDGRFPTPEAQANQQKSRAFFVDLHRNTRQDLCSWAEKQVYIALGMLLTSAATLKIDSCAIEGYDPEKLDAVLELETRGLHSVVMVALGYRSPDDFNAKLPKSRLPASAVISPV